MDASVDKDQWLKFVQKALTPYTTDVGSKGAKPGTYTVKVKFVVNKDGSLSDFVALNDRGVRYGQKSGGNHEKLTQMESGTTKS